MPLLWVAFLLGLAGSPAPAADGDTGEVKLGRGVNIIGYDPIWRARDQARFQEKYFQMLKDAGFNHVRVNLHPFRQMDGTKNWDLPGKWFDTVDWVLGGAGKAGLMVILDLHEFNVMGGIRRGTRKSSWPSGGRFQRAIRISHPRCSSRS